MDIVTISQKGKEPERVAARKAAALLDMPYIERCDRSLPLLQETYDAERILVFHKQGPAMYTGDGTDHRFHLSMAELRLLRIDRGQTDHLIEALGDEPLTSFLDCTAGLGSDSLLVSYTHPECERLVALEGIKPLAYITNFGCRHFVHKRPEVTAALRRIQVANVRYETYLAAAPEKRYDVVYFDPMFEVPVKESPQFLSLRGHILSSTFSAAVLTAALRVAKRRVIVKERPFATVYKELPPDELIGGKYSRVAYGIYYANK